MIELTDEIVFFFQNQSFGIVTTIDSLGRPHSSCKGIVEIDKEGKIYLLDLYMQHTYQNLQRNASISITAVAEHQFQGYCLKGKARLIPRAELDPRLIAAWESKIASRVTQRLIKNIHDEKGHARHPEALLPKPAYMIVMETEEAVDLTPRHLKE